MVIPDGKTPFEAYNPTYVGGAILVLTGVTSREQIERFPYRPTWVYQSVAEIEV